MTNSPHIIPLEDGRWVDEDSWKHCNCILCQDDGAVIGVEQDYCIEGSKLDLPIGEKIMKRQDCKFFIKRREFEPPACIYTVGRSIVAFDCEGCMDYFETERCNTKDDPVSHPAHYTGLTIKGVSIECIEVIEALGLNFLLGNAFKYLWRAGKKTEDPKTDLKKSIWYMTRSLEQ